MGTVMLTHINKLRGTLDARKSSLNHILRSARKSHHRPVGGSAGVNIKHPYRRSLFNGRADTVDNLHIVTLAEIGHTFNNLTVHAHIFLDMPQR